ncbi:MAG: SpoIIIAH-like family protein, partial [Chloroflexi bacterium]
MSIPTQLVILALVIVFAVAGYFIWDRRYRGDNQGDFKPTNEVFKDPTSGKMTRVYEDP